MSTQHARVRAPRKSLWRELQLAASALMPTLGSPFSRSLWQSAHAFVWIRKRRIDNPPQATSLPHGEVCWFMTLDQKIDSAGSVIARVFAENTTSACVTCSFQAECMTLVDLVVAQRPDIPVLFLETGYHFPETYAYRDQMTERLRLNMVNLSSAQTVAEQESQFGILYQSAPDRCCAMRKVGPLFRGLEDYGVWFTALRREQSPTRANLQAVDSFRLPSGKQLLKVSPLADWTNAEVWAYLKRRGIPVLPLYEQGYTSIGCAPCTTPPLDPGNPRSGRWAGQKLECGIHISSG